MENDWELLLNFFPKNWRRLGVQSGAIGRTLKGFATEEELLRTLLIHLACGYSLRETATRAELSSLSNTSDVALLKRLRSCKNWFHEMCLSLLDEQGINLPCSGIRCRLIDATVIRETGITGSMWRLHYSLAIPGLTCDHFDLTSTKGLNSGESLMHFPINEGDFIIADRGYSTPNGVRHVDINKGYLLVRVNPVALPLYEKRGNKIINFNLLKNSKKILRSNSMASFNVIVNAGGYLVEGRVCIFKKKISAAKTAQKRVIRKAKDNQRTIRKETLEYAKYITVFTTFPKDEFTSAEILRWYRLRWQIEIIFKRFKSIAHIGCLPKHNDESSRAWLYGKLFVILLTQKLITHAQLLPSSSKGAKKPVRSPSHWREFSFMFHQIQQAVEPRIDFQTVINFWNRISKNLSEPPRKRRAQMAKYAFKNDA